MVKPAAILYHNPRCSKSRQTLELLRTGEAEYRQLGLDDPTLSRAALIQAMAEHPKLIERPILLTHHKAALGRPPENVLEIL